MRIGVIIAAAAIASAARAENSLSVLEDTSDGCHWTRVNPLTGESKNIARVAPKCARVTLRLSPDLSRALVWRIVGKDDDELSVATVETGSIQKERVPPIGEVAEAGFDRMNRVVAITFADAVFGWFLNATNEWEQSASARRVRYFSDCGNVDLRSFATYKSLVHEDSAAAREVAMKPNEVPSAIRSIPNPNSDMRQAWRRLGSKAGTAYVQLRLNHDCGVNSEGQDGAFTLDKSGKAVELEPKNADTIQLREQLLLVLSSKEKLARVYDVTNMSVVLERHNVTSATFWPIPRKK